MVWPDHQTIDRRRRSILALVLSPQVNSMHAAKLSPQVQSACLESWLGHAQRSQCLQSQRRQVYKGRPSLRSVHRFQQQLRLSTSLSETQLIYTTSLSSHNLRRFPNIINNGFCSALIHLRCHRAWCRCLSCWPDHEIRCFASHITRR